MKKILITLLVLMLTLSIGYAECGVTVLPSEQLNITVTSSSSFIYSGKTDFVLAKNGRVIGIKNLTETSTHLPTSNVKFNTVSGVLPNGLLRVAGLMKYKQMEDGTVQGLTSLPVKIAIEEQYVDLVQSIVENRLNLNELCVSSIICSTFWVTDDYVGHIFYMSDNRIAVGTVYFYNRIPVILYAGDIDNDGNMELGFSAGWTQTVESTPTPTPYDAGPSEEVYTMWYLHWLRYNQSLNVNTNINSVQTTSYQQNVQTASYQQNGGGSYSTTAHCDNDVFDYDNNINTSVNTNTNVNANNSQVTVTTNNNVQNNTLVNNSLLTLNLNTNNSVQTNRNTTVTTTITKPGSQCLRDGVRVANSGTA